MCGLTGDFSSPVVYPPKEELGLGLALTSGLKHKAIVVAAVFLLPGVPVDAGVVLLALPGESSTDTGSFAGDIPLQYLCLGWCC